MFLPNRLQWVRMPTEPTNLQPTTLQVNITQITTDVEHIFYYQDNVQV
jgi:hypothetical protein